MFEEIDKLNAQLNALRPLPEGTLQSLHQALVLEWTYHSNAIEGNTLTLQETKIVLEGITVGGKSMREHFEAINHREAIIFVEDIINNAQPLNEGTIKAIHQLVLKNIDDQGAGIYRNQNVMISGASHTPPSFLQLRHLMDALIKEHLEPAGHNNWHPIEKAARLHTDFVKIHPFIDGNGRTARLLLNLELMRHHYLPVIIRKEDRLDYYQALDSACSQGDYAGFIEQVRDRLIERYHKVLELVA